MLAGPKEIPKAAREGRRSACRPRCCGGGRTSAAPSCSPPRSAPASASPRRELYPSFSLFGTIGLECAQRGPVHPEPRSPASSLFYTVGPTVNWPFFNYGRLTNGVRVEDARFQQLLVNYRDTVLKAAQEVEDALAGFLNAQEATVFEQNVGDRRRSGRWRSRSCSTAKAPPTIQRVLDAQRSLLQQQNSLAQTSSSVATNLIALYKALGGGWEVRAGPAARAGADATRDEGADQLGRHAVHRRGRRTTRNGSPPAGSNR